MARSARFGDGQCLVGTYQIPQNLPSWSEAHSERRNKTPLEMTRGMHRTSKYAPNADMLELMVEMQGRWESGLTTVGFAGGRMKSC